MKKKFVLAGLIVLLIAIVAGLVIFLNTKQPSPVGEEEVEWVTYSNETYKFEVRHPEDWIVSVRDTQGGEPMINIYPSSLKPTLPLTHHSSVPNVSFFPKGVPTEGVIGTTETSHIAFKEPVVRAFDYVLEDGDRFATFATFSGVPSSWEPFGFVWARATVQEYEATCVAETREQVALESCYELGTPGFTLIENGNPNTEEVEIEEKILESFHFID